MSLLFRLLTTAFMLGFGLLVLAKTKQFVDVVGKNEYGERYFGQGGTYTMWKLIGVFLCVGAILVLFWK